MFFSYCYSTDFSSLIFQRELTSILHNNTECSILTVARILCRWNEWIWYKFLFAQQKFINLKEYQKLLSFLPTHTNVSLYK